MNQLLNLRFVIAVVFIYLFCTATSAQPTAPTTPGMINETLIHAKLLFLSSGWFKFIDLGFHAVWHQANLPE